MYERPDVPKDNPNRNKVAAVVLLVVAVALTLLVSTLWRLANSSSALGSHEVSDALASATVQEGGAQALADAAGATVTGDEVETVLFVIVPDSSSTDLSGLYVASIDSTQGAAKLTSLAPEAQLALDSGIASLHEVYASQGLGGLAGGIASTCAVPMDHAVTMTQAGWDAFLQTAAGGSSALASHATELLGGIVSSDLDATGLLDIAKRAVSLGLSASDVASVGATEDGQLDAAALARTVGVIA